MAKVGERVYLEGQKSQSAWSLILAVLTLTAFYSWPFVVFIITVFSPFSRLAFAISVLLYSTLLLPAKVHWSRFLNSEVFRTWREYFSFSYILMQDLNPNSRYVIAEFPHGIIPMGPLLAGTAVDTIFPGMKVLGIAASSVFAIPFMSWIGTVPATKANLENLIQKGPTAVVVGGIAEMFMLFEDREEILVKSRRGFIRAAIKEGVDLLPVYHFGNSQLCRTLHNPILEWISRKIRASIIFPYGRYFTPCPFRREILMAVGRPVKTRDLKTNEPIPLEEVQDDFIRALNEVYEKTKTLYGWKNRPLIIN